MRTGGMLRIISRCGDVDVGGKQRGVKGGDEHVNGGRWNYETREASLRKREGILHQASLFAFGHSWGSCVFILVPRSFWRR